NDPDVLAMIGSSAALCLSGLPFGGPLGAVRVALVEGELVANPTYKQLAASQLEVVIAGTEDAVLMVESGGREISEDQMLEARAEAMVAAFEAVWAHLVSVDHAPDEPATKAKAREYFEKVEKTEVRRLIVDKGIRVDGRSVKEVRPIWSEIGYLPRAHGSALFTRGE